ncbi:MAG: hypothetical protein KDC67_04590, partial [Ignavibacteriae bacterium]|nr:hypothetical protein [Ignavibacteriota bacterium]
SSSQKNAYLINVRQEKFYAITQAVNIVLDVFVNAVHFSSSCHKSINYLKGMYLKPIIHWIIDFK